jgi:hypothetical protein
VELGFRRRGLGGRNFGVLHLTFGGHGMPILGEGEALRACGRFGVARSLLKGRGQ